MFVHPTNKAVILDLKGFFIYFLTYFDYMYRHQNITIIVKRESETRPISEIAIIILSLKFIGSFKAAAFPFVFPPSRFRLLSNGRSLSCPPQFAPAASRKKRDANSQTIISTKIDA